MSNTKPDRPQAIDDATRQAAWDEIVRLQIRGASQKECAERLGFHVNTIKKWCAKPEFKLKLMRTRALVFDRTQDAGDQAAKKAVEEVEQLIEKYAAEAITKIHSLMEKAESERVQLKAATDLADRGKRTSKVHKVLTAGTMMVFTPEALAAAALAAKEIQENRAIGRVVKPVELDTSMIDLIENE